MKAPAPNANATGTVQPIPFRRDDDEVVAHGWGSLLIAVLLLAVVAAGLRAAKRRGLLAGWAGVATEAGAKSGLSLERSLRLSTKTTVHVLRDGECRHLLIESSVQTRIVAYPPRTTDEERPG